MKDQLAALSSYRHNDKTQFAANVQILQFSVQEWRIVADGDLFKNKIKSLGYDRLHKVSDRRVQQRTGHRLAANYCGCHHSVGPGPYKIHLSLLLHCSSYYL